MTRTANIIEEGRYGGPQAQILGVAERLKVGGIDTVVICPEQESERFYTEAVKRKAEMRRVSMHRLSRDPLAIFRYFITFPKEAYFLYQLLKKGNIDIVHCNSARQFKGVVAGWSRSDGSGKGNFEDIQGTFWISWPLFI